MNHDPSASSVRADTTRSAQRLRLRRILGGSASYACTTVIVALAWHLGYLPGVHAALYVAAVVAINAGAMAAVASGVNLKLKDPSLTAPLVVASLAPAVYVMYHVSEPMIRTSFLLTASVAMLYGLLVFDVRGMLKLGATALASYLLLLGALQLGAPERLTASAEVLTVVAYALVLAQVAFIGSFIAGLRRSLREKHDSLTEAMKELEELATRDPLTRLPNRHTAMQQLHRELSRSERRRQGGDGLCVALLDVDHFKRVNDRFGHQAGDQVLRLIGSALDAVIRQGDFVARFGGEEFLILLPETTIDGGRLVAERIREAIAGIPLDDLPGREAVTASIGVAEHRPGERMETALGHADVALYQAKHAGRNRVALWEDGMVGAAGFEPATSAV